MIKVKKTVSAKKTSKIKAKKVLKPKQKAVSTKNIKPKKKGSAKEKDFFDKVKDVFL